MYLADTLAIGKPHDLLERFSSCIEGELNDLAMGFLQSLNKENPLGLAELISKLQNLQIKIEANIFHCVIQVLTDQLKIPPHAMQNIEHFFHATDKQALLIELQNLDLKESKLQQSIFHIMNELNIFNNHSTAEQFLRTVISILLEWAAHPQRTIKDAAKWLKTVLNTPSQSVIGQIIQLVADHLQLSDYLIAGKTRNMDGLELFFLLKNLTNPTDIVLLADSNKILIQHINASILTIVIYKNSPSAFYDIVSWQEQHPEYSLWTELAHEQVDSWITTEFLHSQEFKPYFSQSRYQDNGINHHVFMTTLATYLHTALQTPDLAKLAEFAKHCIAQFNSMDLEQFMHWYQHAPDLQAFDSQAVMAILESLSQLAYVQKTRHSGRIRASAMNLVGLGYSHRSVSSQITGGFKPLVNTEIAAHDAENLQFMRLFLNQKTAAEHLKFLQELLLGYVVYHKKQLLNLRTKNQLLAEQSRALVRLNQPTRTAITTKVSRANPMHRNRMFTPKQDSLREIRAYSAVLPTINTVSQSKEPEAWDNSVSQPIPMIHALPVPAKIPFAKTARRRKQALARRRMARKRVGQTRSMTV